MAKYKWGAHIDCRNWAFLLNVCWQPNWYDTGDELIVTFLCFVIELEVKK